MAVMIRVLAKSMKNAFDYVPLCYKGVQKRYITGATLTGDYVDGTTLTGFFRDYAVELKILLRYCWS